MLEKLAILKWRIEYTVWGWIYDRKRKREQILRG